MPVLTDIQPISRTIRRQSAVVLTNKGLTVSAVAALVGCCTSTVARSLKRMSDTGDVVDLPRSGRPATYSETFKLELIGFYCQTQPFPNSGRWTLRWTAVHLAARPEIVRISLNVVRLYNLPKLKSVFVKQECIMYVHNLNPRQLICLSTGQLKRTFVMIFGSR